MFTITKQSSSTKNNVVAKYEANFLLSVHCNIGLGVYLILIYLKQLFTAQLSCPIPNATQVDSDPKGSKFIIGNFILSWMYREVLFIFLSLSIVKSSSYIYNLTYTILYAPIRSNGNHHKPRNDGKYIYGIAFSGSRTSHSYNRYTYTYSPERCIHAYIYSGKYISFLSQSRTH